MKITKLTIKNVGAIANEVITIDKPLLLFYGDILQGKSTILNCVRWVCGGEFPDEIIRKGQPEASIMLEFDGGMVARSWYINKAGVTTSRPVTFIRNGKSVPAPVNEIKRLLNPFMLDQDHLVKMNELERKRFFADLFAVDTVELDKAIFNKANEASTLRAKISGYGLINTEKVEAVDVEQLVNQLNFERQQNAEQVEKFRAAEIEVRDFNATVKRSKDSAAEVGKQIVELENQLADLKIRKAKLDEWINAHPEKPDPAPVALVDTTKLEAQLREAGAQNVRHEQYQANLKRLAEKQANEKKLLELEAEQRKLKADKLAKLKDINDSCKIAGLKFDEDGQFTYHGNHSGMLSTSQLMTLSSEISALYPEGLGVELIDRGESLGKSIFTFVKRAEEQKISILATIVGERPAEVPENIGVFVVSGGKISA